MSSLFIVFQAKEEIHCLLLRDLQASISKVRSSVVSCFHVQRVIYCERLFLASLMINFAWKVDPHGQGENSSSRSTFLCVTVFTGLRHELPVMLLVTLSEQVQERK